MEDSGEQDVSEPRQEGEPVSSTALQPEACSGGAQPGEEGTATASLSERRTSSDSQDTADHAGSKDCSPSSECQDMADHAGNEDCPLFSDAPQSIPTPQDPPVPQADAETHSPCSSPAKSRPKDHDTLKKNPYVKLDPKQMTHILLECVTADPAVEKSPVKSLKKRAVKSPVKSVEKAKESVVNRAAKSKESSGGSGEPATGCEKINPASQTSAETEDPDADKTEDPDADKTEDPDADKTVKSGGAENADGSPSEAAHGEKSGISSVEETPSSLLDSGSGVVDNSNSEEDSSKTQQTRREKCGEAITAAEEAGKNEEENEAEQTASVNEGVHGPPQDNTTNDSGMTDAANSQPDNDETESTGPVPCADDTQKDSSTATSCADSTEKEGNAAPSDNVENAPSPTFSVRTEATDTTEVLFVSAQKDLNGDEFGCCEKLDGSAGGGDGGGGCYNKENVVRKCSVVLLRQQHLLAENCGTLKQHTLLKRKSSNCRASCSASERHKAKGVKRRLTKKKLPDLQPALDCFVLLSDRQLSGKGENAKPLARNRKMYKTSSSAKQPVLKKSRKSSVKKPPLRDCFVALNQEVMTSASESKGFFQSTNTAQPRSKFAQKKNGLPQRNASSSKSAPKSRALGSRNASENGRASSKNLPRSFLPLSRDRKLAGRGRVEGRHPSQSTGRKRQSAKENSDVEALKDCWVILDREQSLTPSTTSRTAKSIGKNREKSSATSSSSSSSSPSAADCEAMKSCFVFLPCMDYISGRGRGAAVEKPSEAAELSGEGNGRRRSGHSRQLAGPGGDKSKACALPRAQTLNSAVSSSVQMSDCLVLLSPLPQCRGQQDGSPPQKKALAASCSERKSTTVSAPDTGHRGRGNSLKVSLGDNMTLSPCRVSLTALTPSSLSTQSPDKTEPGRLAAYSPPRPGRLSRKRVDSKKSHSSPVFVGSLRAGKKRGTAMQCSAKEQHSGEAVRECCVLLSRLTDTVPDCAGLSMDLPVLHRPPSRKRRLSSTSSGPKDFSQVGETPSAKHHQASPEKLNADRRGTGKSEMRSAVSSKKIVATEKRVRPSKKSAASLQYEESDDGHSVDKASTLPAPNTRRGRLANARPKTNLSALSQSQSSKGKSSSSQINASDDDDDLPPPPTRKGKRTKKRTKNALMSHVLEGPLSKKARQSDGGATVPGGSSANSLQDLNDMMLAAGIWVRPLSEKGTEETQKGSAGSAGGAKTKGSTKTGTSSSVTAPPAPTSTKADFRQVHAEAEKAGPTTTAAIRSEDLESDVLFVGDDFVVVREQSDDEGDDGVDGRSSAGNMLQGLAEMVSVIGKDSDKKKKPDAEGKRDSFDGKADDGKVVLNLNETDGNIYMQVLPSGDE